MKKLEIGPGPRRLGDDWMTLDCLPRPDGTVDCVATWGDDPLPFRDGEFDLIYSAHCLEHCSWYKTIAALKETARILKAGGRIEIWVPDFQYIVQCYLRGECGDDWRRFNPDGDYMLYCAGRLFTYGGPGGYADPNWHRAIFDERHLANCLKAAGFCNVQRSTGHERGHRHGPISLGMTGEKS